MHDIFAGYELGEMEGRGVWVHERLQSHKFSGVKVFRGDTQVLGFVQGEFLQLVLGWELQGVVGIQEEQEL